MFGVEDEGLPTCHKFEVSKVDTRRESMRKNNDSSMSRVQGWGKDRWRVEISLRWAEVGEEKTYERLR